MVSVVDKLAILFNPIARQGKSRKVLAKVIDLLNNQNVKFEILEPSSRGGVQDSVLTAVESGAKRLLLVGGDGLIHDVLPVVASSEVEVGIMPAGTGNDFSRHFGMSNNVSYTLERALGKTRKVDLIAIDSSRGRRYAATVLTAGFSAVVNDRAERSILKSRSKYSWASVRELPSLKPVDIKLFEDGQLLNKGQLSFFALGNTKFFGGGMKVCPYANPFDGALDLVVVGEVSRLLMGRMMPTVFWGGHVKHPKVNTQRVERLQVQTKEPIWADGELISSLIDEWEVSVVPGALNLAC